MASTRRAFDARIIERTFGHRSFAPPPKRLLISRRQRHRPEILDHVEVVGLLAPLILGRINLTDFGLDSYLFQSLRIGQQEPLLGAGGGQNLESRRAPRSPLLTSLPSLKRYPAASSSCSASRRPSRFSPVPSLTGKAKLPSMIAGLTASANGASSLRSAASARLSVRAELRAREIAFACAHIGRDRACGSPIRSRTA